MASPRSIGIDAGATRVDEVLSKVETSPSPAGSGATRRPRRRNWGSLLFAVPLIALLAVFIVLPVGRMAWYSLTSYDGLQQAEYIGLENYRVLFEDPDFLRILMNTVLLSAGIVVWVAVPFVLAVVIFPMRRANLIRTALFVPVLLPPVIIGNVFRLVLADGGPINGALRSLGLGALAQGWLTDERIVLFSVVSVITWAVTGTGVLLYSAALTAIPKEQVEAAVVDGARWHHVVWFIYRPALRPVTRFFVLLLTVTTITGFFPWIFGLTRGGPGVASTTLDYEIYETGISGGLWGRASAVAVCSIALLVVLVGGQLLARRLRAARERRVAARPRRGALLSRRRPPKRATGARRSAAFAKGGGLLRNAVVAVALIAVFFPILWVIRLAFKPIDDYVGAPSSVGGGWTLGNFQDAWTVGHLGQGLLNSVLVVPLAALIATIAGALASFALAKLRMPGRRAIIPLLAVSVAVPLTAIAIPLFDQGLVWGYTDSRLGLSAVYGGVFAAWGTLFLYSHFNNFPEEIIDSARVDGASALQIFLRIALPLAMPAVATVFVIDLVVAWNELIVGLISLPDASKQTVTVAIATFTGQFRSGGPLTAAGVLIASLPIVIVYFLAQRFIRAGVLGGAVKG